MASWPSLRTSSMTRCLRGKPAWSAATAIFMRCFIITQMAWVLLLLVFTLGARAGEPLILDETHESQVFGETRHYRIFLPPDYAASGKRYPVIYWFHGWSERYNKPVAREAERNYDQGDGVYGGDTIGRFVGHHDVIVVKWDGYNPRTPDEVYPRPYN